MISLASLYYFTVNGKIGTFYNLLMFYYVMVNTLNIFNSCSILELCVKGRCKIVIFITMCFRRQS